MFRKNTCFWHGSQECQQIRMKIINVITSRPLLILPEIFGNFPEISENIKFPENLQPHCQASRCQHFNDQIHDRTA